MTSGRKNRVVISCVTFETAKIADPVAFYQATHVHLIWYAKDPESESGKIYKEFHDRVCELIREQSSFDVEVFEHNEKVYDFTAMLRTVLGIIQKERKESPLSDIYVNISAGTSEYAAAAAIASMMVPGTIPFSVGTKEFTVPNKTIRNVYYENEKPVGLTKKAKDPYLMPCYHIDVPEEHLIRALRILHHRNMNKQSVTGSSMISILKKEGLWMRGELVIEEKKKKTDKERSEAVYYQRDFINKWSERDWVQKNEFGKRYEVTERGMIVLETFYTCR